MPGAVATPEEGRACVGVLLCTSPVLLPPPYRSGPAGPFRVLPPSGRDSAAAALLESTAGRRRRLHGTAAAAATAASHGLTPGSVAHTQSVLRAAAREAGLGMIAGGASAARTPAFAATPTPGGFSAAAQQQQHRLPPPARPRAPPTAAAAASVVSGGGVSAAGTAASSSRAELQQQRLAAVPDAARRLVQARSQAGEGAAGVSRLRVTDPSPPLCLQAARQARAARSLNAVGLGDAGADLRGVFVPPPSSSSRSR